ncbi:MAG: phosphoribosyltransferase family protein [Cytophagales bacterium]|nr:phosphoribosyltransferase family protein [Cytophagales bacterium]MDW8384037.1 phosphoribosyltransferase family protein [Flammeovirgaceae bacterium]
MQPDSLILNHQQVTQKIRRIAYEIYERNFEEECLLIAGIEGTGYLLAEVLKDEICKIAPFTVEVLRVKLDKIAPSQSDVEISCQPEFLKGKTIILVDDVQNSGKTLSYSLKPFLNVPIKKLQIAVLVNRGYRRFPVSPDYIGYELSTTVNQHITVVLDKPNQWGVYLF